MKSEAIIYPNGEGTWIGKLAQRCMMARWEGVYFQREYKDYRFPALTPGFHVLRHNPSCGMALRHSCGTKEEALRLQTSDRDILVEVLA